MAEKEVKVRITALDQASAAIGKVRAEFDRLSNAAGSQSLKKNLDGVNDQVQRIRNSVTGIFAGLVGSVALGGFVKLAETSKQVNAQLKLAAESAEDFAQSQEFAKKTALETGQAYESIANLYAKIRMNAGLAAEETAKLTGIIAKVTQVGNTGGPGVDAAIFQLQQGLASGVLRGEELNSVMEQTPSLAKAIADGLGVNIGQLRKIASEGKLTTVAVRDALFKMEADINAQFAQLPLTSRQAFQNVRTQAIIALGKLDEQLGLTEKFANILQSIANNMQTVIGLVAGAVVALTTVFLASAGGSGALATGLAAVLIGLKAILTPVGLVAAALGGLTAFVVANIDKTVEFGNQTTTVGAIVSAAWRTIKDAISDALRLIAQATGLAGNEMLGTFRGLGSVVGTIFKTLIDVINLFITSVFTGMRLIARVTGITAASIVEQFTRAINNTRALFSALASDVSDAFSGRGFAFDKVSNTVQKGLRDATGEAQNFKDALIEAYQIEAKFAEDGGVLSALKKGIADRLEETKAVAGEFKKRSPITSPNEPSKEELKAARQLAQARQDLEDAVFQQAKRLSDDQAQRDIQSARELFEFKAISANDYFQRLDKLQTDLSKREIAELERQKAVRQAIIDSPKTSPTDRFKAIADITELSASAAIVERNLQDSRSKLINEIVSAEAKRLKTQQDFIKEMEREVMLSGMTNKQREVAVSLIRAQELGVEDLNRVGQLQNQIQANNDARARLDEIIRQQNQIFESVQRGVQQAFSDGIYNAVKGGNIEDILRSFSDTMLRVFSNTLAGGLTDTFFNLFGRQGASGESAPAGIFSGMFSGLNNGLNNFLGKLKTGLSGFFSAIGNIFSRGGGGGGFLSGFTRLLGFADGGYTGNGSKYQPAGVVHAGEYVFSAESVRRLGLAALDNLHRLSKGAPVPMRPRLGYAEGGFVTPVPDRSQPRAQPAHIAVSVSPDALNMTLRDWLEGEFARIAVGAR